jgi:hypothetical protein
MSFVSIWNGISKNLNRYSKSQFYMSAMRMSVDLTQQVPMKHFAVVEETDDGRGKVSLRNGISFLFDTISFLEYLSLISYRLNE